MLTFTRPDLPWLTSNAFQALTEWQDQAFGLAMAERNLPNYSLFHEATKFGDPDFARKLMNKGWSYLSGELNSLKSLERHLEEWEDLIPDPEDFDAYGVYPALDEAVAIQSAILAILDPVYRVGQDCSELSCSTIASFLEVIDANEEDSMTFWEQELSFQQVLIDKVQAVGTPSGQSVNQIKRYAQGDGSSQIGICLSDE